MRCEEARDLMVQRLMTEIEPVHDTALERHLSTCQECRLAYTALVSADRRLQAAGAAQPLPSQREAILAQLPGARRRRLGLRLSRSVVGAAAAACLALGAWQAVKYAQMPTGRPAMDAVLLQGNFFTQRRDGSGWVATAALPTPVGQATAYYYVEAAPGDKLRAAILLKQPSGALTREVELGEVSHGRLPFTQPEFRLLTVGQQTLLAVATDADGAGRLQVFAYHPASRRLVRVPFGPAESLAISTWPVAVDGGIRTQLGTELAEWQLTKRWSFVRASRQSPLRPEIAGSRLAEAELSTPAGPVTVRLHGTMTEGASLYLHRPDGTVTQEVELGKPSFVHGALTTPKLHKLQVGGQEVLALLADPLVGHASEAVLRVFAYDPARNHLRLVPFAAGEMLVTAVPLAEDGVLRTQQLAGDSRWRLTAAWLLEPAAP